MLANRRHNPLLKAEVTSGKGEREERRHKERRGGRGGKLNRCALAFVHVKHVESKSWWYNGL